MLPSANPQIISVAIVISGQFSKKKSHILVKFSTVYYRFIFSKTLLCPAWTGIWINEKTLGWLRKWAIVFKCSNM